MLTTIFIVFCIFILIYLIVILPKKENRTPTLIIAILSLIVAVIGVIYSVINNDNNGLNINGQGVYAGRDLSGDIIYNNNYNNIEEDISLDDAYRKIELKDYLAAGDIYLRILEQNNEDTIALCNLGYIFEKGLGTEVDLDKAIEYYDKAILLGNKQALHNKLSLYLNNDMPTEPIGELIWYGIELEDIDICKFVFASLQNNENMNEDSVLTFCKSLDEFILEDLWEWRESGLVKKYSTPTNTGILRYKLISNGSETTGNYFAALYAIYQTEERYCPYVDLLKAGFDK